ncbi:MAG: hypothetical protein NUW00_01910 [Candidatus Kaiserbacteria bacterium]|nr:hypothetical protein [Candidatus Kaiserbacteria bacterium]
MQQTKEDVRNIFFSGSHAFRSDEELVGKLHFLLTEHYLSCERFTIGNKEDFFSLCDDAEKIIIRDEAAGGSTGHVALKLLAERYLNSFGITVYFEHSFCGYYPDVISTDLQTVVECGHTNNADKILVYFTQGHIAELIQIPYPADDDTRIYGYRFTAHKDLYGFLNTEFEEQKKVILKIVNRRRDT